MKMVLRMDNQVPKSAKAEFVGYKFMYEKGQNNLWSEKTYKTMNDVRKAAIPYAYPPANIYKIYKAKAGPYLQYEKAIGFVSRMNGLKYHATNDDFEVTKRYIMNPDGTLGKVYDIPKKRK